MKVRRPLPGERTVIRDAVLGRPEPLEALLDDRRVLPVIIRVHLHVRGRYVHLVAVLVDAVVVRLLPVVRTLPARVTLGTVVGGRVAHEAVLERLVALLVPLEVPDHLLFLDEDSTAAVEAVEVLATAEVLAVGTAALLAAGVAAHVARVVDDRLGQSGFGTTRGRGSGRAQEGLRRDW